MKKAILTIGLVAGMMNFGSAQLIVSKMLGKDAKNYGMGFGIFTFLDFQLPSVNRSIVVELLEFVYFPQKGGGGYFAAPAGKGYYSIKVGYKNYFSEDDAGFYIQPSVGGAAVSIARENEPEADEAYGFSGSLEGGYSFAVGQTPGHKINLGLKYEYCYAKQSHQIQTLGLRMSYSFGLFRRRDY
jgi:hypothetical protein